MKKLFQMKILRLLNKKYLPILFCFFFLQNSELFSNEPVDIWNLEKEENLEEVTLEQTKQEEDISENSIYKIEPEKNSDFAVELDQTLKSKEIEIVGIYDPSENSLRIDMWKNSDGKKILDLFSKIEKIIPNENLKIVK